MFIGNPRPIEDLVNRPGVNVDEVMEQADIGGIAMIRSAAKNFRYVTCAVNPARYATVMHELRAHEGQVSFTTRYKLAQEALVAVAQYDLALADFLRTHEPAES
jgi:phosphoribosylaminoimidazolecarboxamide formyltransferase/IMP cyclohydrolase